MATNDESSKTRFEPNFENVLSINFIGITFKSWKF